MNTQQVVELDGTRYFMTPFILPKLATAATCAVPAYESSFLGRSNKCSPGVSKYKNVPDKDGILACDKYEIGDFVYTYQFVVFTPGILPTGYGCEPLQNLFNVGTIYNDAASGLIWI